MNVAARATVEHPFVAGLERRGVVLSDAEWAEVMERHGGICLALVEDLVRKERVSKDAACAAWADPVGVAHVNPMAIVVTDEALARVPREVAVKAGVLPVTEIDGVLTLVMPDPADEALKRRLEAITGAAISPVFALPDDIREAVAVYYSDVETLAGIIRAFEQKEGDLLRRLSPERVGEVARADELVRVLDAILQFAIKERASDVHLEPGADFTRVRFRVDGRLRDILRLSKHAHPPIVCRLKILCNLNIAESRFPQDGRFSLTLGTARIDTRVSFLPTVDGNKVVVRLLSSGDRQQRLTLDDMLVSQDILTPFRSLVKSPTGLFFVTGPTGSGKTTTLYAALQELNTPDVNISTIEDPVEVRLPGVNQTQVNSHIDLRFATLLRSLLRQDPDVLLVGEIRDLETAKIATEAALTGHLVLSTLHTNNAIQAVVRLMDIGIEPYMVAPSLLGVLAQRLAAKICENCKESYTPEADVLDRYFEDWREVSDVSFFRGRGCAHCRGTGYQGRVSFHELVIVTDEMRSLIGQRAGTRELTVAARRTGYRPLRYDGLRKVLLGLTTLEEIEANTVEEYG